jgi:hypothetical protein
MNEEHKDQQLDAAYRQASATEAGRPDAKTRAAILAEAAAAARRRVPAANESRYLLRAVAGIAVVGVGLLLWRQTDHRLPGEAPVLEVPRVAQQSAEPEADLAFVPDPQEARSRVAPSPAVLPEPPPAERDELEEMQVTGARVQAGVPSELSAEELLRRHFPAQYEGDATRRVWLVRNAAGEVVRTGELDDGEQLAELIPEIQRSLGMRELAPQAVHSLRNARGQPVELSILQARE